MNAGTLIATNHDSLPDGGSLTVGTGATLISTPRPLSHRWDRQRICSSIPCRNQGQWSSRRLALLVLLGKRRSGKRRRSVCRTGLFGSRPGEKREFVAQRRRMSVPAEGTYAESKKMKRRIRPGKSSSNVAGFTLVELLVVIAIVGP